jgi:hypothetical protein
MSASPSIRRQASLTPALLFTLPVLLALLFLAVNHLHLTFARAATQRVTDASALAGAQALVVDQHLTADDNDLLNLEQLAFAQAQVYADLNPLSPATLVYDVTEPSSADNDIRFTTIDNPLDATGTLKLIDSVEVIGKRTDGSAVPIFGAPLFSLRSASIVTRSKAVLDRNVLGFRPLFQNNIPVAPIAFLNTDWNTQVAVTVGPPNSISQFSVTLGDISAPKASFLHVGKTTLTELSVQIASGIPPTDLIGFGGEFVLSPAGTLVVPGDATTTDKTGLNDIRTQLLALKASGAVRAWPLAIAPINGTTVTIADFVAARVADVGGVQVGDGKGNGNDASLTLTLSPAFMSSPTIVTDPTRPINPYLCRVHLAQ